MGKIQIYAKLMDGLLFTTCASAEDADLIVQITADGFKPYDDDAGKPDVGLYQEACPVYRENANSISVDWEIIDNSPSKIQAEIAGLQERIEASDYKVIKSYEYALAGQDAPYDVDALHSERQALRNSIKELESRLDSEMLQ